MGAPPNGWFIRENPIKVVNWGYPYFRKPKICLKKWGTQKPHALTIAKNHVQNQNGRTWGNPPWLDKIGHRTNPREQQARYAW